MLDTKRRWTCNQLMAIEARLREYAPGNATPVGDAVHGDQLWTLHGLFFWTAVVDEPGSCAAFEDLALDEERTPDDAVSRALEAANDDTW
jgi:hypothetical protein